MCAAGAQRQQGATGRAGRESTEGLMQHKHGGAATVGQGRLISAGACVLIDVTMAPTLEGITDCAHRQGRGVQLCSSCWHMQCKIDICCTRYDQSTMPKSHFYGVLLLLPAVF